MGSMKRVLFKSAALAFLTVAVGLRAEIENAVPIRTVTAEYPAELRREKATGMVVVSFTVNERGEVVEPAVVKSTRHEFESSALAAVRRWKFKPAKDNGTPVARKLTVPIEFRLEES
jgi:protein TonB